MPDVLQDPVSNEETIILGYLQKRLNRTHKWKKRWGVLRNPQFYWYKDPKESKALKVLHFQDILSVSVVSDHHNNHFAIYTSNKVIHFKTELHQDMVRWIESFQKVLKLNDVLETPLQKSTLPGKMPCPRPTEPLQRTALDSGDGEPLKKLERPQDLSTGTFPHLNAEYSGAEDAFASSGLSEGSINEDITYNPPPQILEEEETESLVNVPTKCTSNLHLVHTTEEEEFIYEGYLLRLRKRYNQWRRFYIILTNHTMSFYKNVDHVHPYRTISVDNIVDVIELDPISSTKTWCILLITPEKRMRFCAPNEEEMTQWLASIKTLIERRKHTA